MNQIAIFEPDTQQRVEVRLEGDTVWLSQRQMAELFGKDVRTVSEHIGKVFADGELARDDSTVRKFRIVRREGDRRPGSGLTSGQTSS